MKKRTLSILLAGAVASVAIVVAVRSLRRAPDEGEARCGEGFVARGTRCCSGDAAGADGACVVQSCRPPLVLSGGGACDAPDTKIAIARTELSVGPSDWEAEGRVPPRQVRAGPFDMDAFEVTEGKLRCPSCLLHASSFVAADAARAASGVTFGEAADFCKSRGGRLPTDDEWLVAAMGALGKRYPWGDTGAVCRRAAFGLSSGPCGTGARGPDTVGAHGLGDSPLGVHDLAGNVAEWVVSEKPTVRGGSYATSLATELRTWAKEELASKDVRDPRVGFRCVYDH